MAVVEELSADESESPDNTTQVADEPCRDELPRSATDGDTVGDTDNSEEDDVFTDAVEHEEDIGRSITRAKGYKAKGNELFHKKAWRDAADMYTKAIHACPRSDRHAGEQAVYFGNRAACAVQLEEYESAVEDCNAAIEAKGDYVRVLLRRAQVLERLERYDEALSDINHLLELDPGLKEAHMSRPRLERLQAEKTERMKDEAMSKLKDLGNSILGKFGMSLDNFKVEQGEDGGYSVKMNQNTQSQ